MHSDSEQCLNVAGLDWFFHGSNTGSNPVGDANKRKELAKNNALPRSIAEQLTLSGNRPHSKERFESIIQHAKDKHPYSHYGAYEEISLVRYASWPIHTELRFSLLPYSAMRR